jgi:Transposase DDE domain
LNYNTKLETILKQSFHLQAQRITAIRMFTSAAIKTRSVDFKQLSLAMNPAVDDASNIKRLQRLVDEVKLEAADKRHFVLMGRTKVRVSLDRTEWDFGSVTNNLLTAGVETSGLAVPVHTKDLGKCGASNDDERIQAVDAILEIIPVECIEVLTADREFLSLRFLAHLLAKGILFSARLKSDAIIEHNRERKSAAEWFQAYQRKSLRSAVVYGSIANICGRRLKKPNGKQDYLIVVTNLEPKVGFELYRTRWKIETLFGALKSRGFNLEETRVTQSHRLENLLLLLGIAILWALRVGLFVSSAGQDRVRKDGTRFYSLFRVGLDFLRRLFLNPKLDLVVWDKVIRVLSCT